MNSLVLTRGRPDSPGGSTLRSLQNIRCLATLGAVDVVSVGVEEAGDPVEGIREWRPFSMRQRSTWDRIKSRCWLVRPGVYPRFDMYHSQNVTGWLSQRVAACRYDVVVIETLSLGSYLGDLKRAGCRVVFDAHNVESALRSALAFARSDDGAPILRRVKDRLLQRRMEEAERRAVLGADLVWACSDEDARQIESVFGKPRRMTVIANGVDVEAYRRTQAPPPDDDWSEWPITLVYPGSMAYYPNEQAAIRLITEILPLLRARGCRARVVVVGRDPTPALLAAARKDLGVEVTGRVESVVPYLAQPCVVTLPIALGSGTRLKILEAFAVGRPVVSTAKGAEGIDAVDGEHLLIRESSDAIAGAVIDLWSRPAMREAVCRNALDLVRRRYSWTAAAEKIAQSLGLEPISASVACDTVTSHEVDVKGSRGGDSRRNVACF